MVRNPGGSFMMDPERQPLLGHHVGPGSDVRHRRYRPLTSEEVLTSRQDVTWHRARFFVVVMFWAIMAMFLSGVACLLIQAPRCTTPTPSVPPVHLSFAPLVSGSVADVDKVEHIDDNGKFELWMG